MFKISSDSEKLILIRPEKNYLKQIFELKIYYFWTDVSKFKNQNSCNSSKNKIGLKPVSLDVIQAVYKAVVSNLFWFAAHLLSYEVI